MKLSIGSDITSGHPQGGPTILWPLYRANSGRLCIRGPRQAQASTTDPMPVQVIGRRRSRMLRTRSLMNSSR